MSRLRPMFLFPLLFLCGLIPGPGTAGFPGADGLGMFDGNESAARPSAWQPIGSGNISISKRVSPRSARVGRTVTYTLVVRNAGPSPATRVVVTDSLPVEVRLVSSRSSRGSCRGKRVVRCALGTLESGGRATITIKGKVLKVGSFRNRASVTASEPDRRAADNLAQVRIVVRG